MYDLALFKGNTHKINHIEKKIAKIWCKIYLSVYTVLLWALHNRTCLLKEWARSRTHICRKGANRK